MAQLIRSIGPGVALSDRTEACRDARTRIVDLPSDMLADVYAATSDLMNSNAPLEARRAGFSVLSGLLEHPHASLDLRTTLLQCCTVVVDPSGTEDQFRSLQAALTGPLSLSPLTEEIIDFTLTGLMPQFEAQNAARKRVRSENRGGGIKEAPAEERGMYKILDFLVQLIDGHSDLFSESKLVLLFELALSIVEKASTTGTVERVCLIIRSVAVMSRIPSTVLRRCLEDLCAIYNTTQRLKDVTWECLELLLKSDHQDENEIVVIVLDTIGLPPQERQQEATRAPCAATGHVMHLTSSCVNRKQVLRLRFGTNVSRLIKGLIKSVNELKADSAASSLCFDKRYLHAVNCLSGKGLNTSANLCHQSHTVCGAIRTARFLMTSQGKPHIPTLTMDRFLNALSRVNFGSRRIRKEVLRTIGLILTDSTTGLVAVNIGDWSLLFDIINRAIDEKRLGSISRQSIDTVASDDHDPSDANESHSRIVGAEELLADQVIYIANALVRLWPRGTQSQHRYIRDFLLKIEWLLPSGFVTGFLLNLVRDDLFVTSPADAYGRLNELADLFALGDGISRELRCTMILLIQEALLSGLSEAARGLMHSLVLKLLRDFEMHRDFQVGNALSKLMITEFENDPTNLEQLRESLELVWPLLSVPDDQFLPGKSMDFETDSTNSVSLSLVQLFLRSIEISPKSAVILYSQLVAVCNAQHLPASSRLPAVKLFTRIRCDLQHRILIIPSPDIQSLAATLCRTETTLPSRSSMMSTRHHNSGPEDKVEVRTNRVSGTSAKTQSTIRSNPRSSTRHDRNPSIKPPLWLYPGGPALPIDPPLVPSQRLRLYTPKTSKEDSLHLGDWLVSAISILQQPNVDWEIFSYVLVHLPAQLSNRELFTNSSPHIRMLRRILVDQLLAGTIHEPPPETGVRKGDIALCLYHALTMLVGYTDKAEREEQERIVQAFVDGVTKWERTARFCIQSLTICCLVVPAAVTNWLSAILQRMSQMITQSHLSVDILEFLASLARHRKLYVNFREEEYRTVFAICVRYLEHSREQRLRLLTPADRATSTPLAQSQTGTEERNAEKPDLNEDLPQYVFSLAYHVLTVWFLAVKIGDRNDHVGWITSNLAWKDASGNEIMEEQSQVTLDMMMRTAYLNLGETAFPEPFKAEDGRVLTKTWLLGLSIVTIETGASTGVSRVTKRQASGTTYALYRPQTAALPPHHEASPEEERGSDVGINIFPNHVLLQLTSSIAPTPFPMEAICLPEDEAVKRALTAFDRNDTVDGYKVGVIYVGNDQTTESSILGNIEGSAAFETFLDGLGTKINIRGAAFNTQGLDRESGMDGDFTYAWRDRVTEIVFHVPTMMPTDFQNDPSCVNKKRHIGNDYVNIIWNESGHPFKFETFASQFNCVNIVIVPDGLLVPEPENLDPVLHQAFGLEKEPYYTIQVLTAESFPELSPVSSYKLLPLKALPLLTRQLALQASVFSNVWTNRDTGEHASSWRNRLREIKRLRERYANTGTSTSDKYPGAKSHTNYQNGDSFEGRVVMGGIAELGEDLVVSLDFSRWAGPNA